MTTETTGPRKHTAVRLARMATTIAQRRTRATRTSTLTFNERDESAVGGTAIAAAFPHSRLIGQKEELLETAGHTLGRKDARPAQRCGSRTTIGPMSKVTDEAREIAARKTAELAALQWEALDEYESRDEDVVSASGRAFRVVSRASWDMDAWQSDMRITVTVYTRSGWRRFFPTTERALRRGEDLPERST